MCTSTIACQKCVCFVFLVALTILSGLECLDMSEHRLRHRRNRPPSHGGRCPELDVSWKVFKADAVAVAFYENRSSGCKHKNSSCTVNFRVQKWLKSPEQNAYPNVRLDFRTSRRYCEYDEVDSVEKVPYFLVKQNHVTKNSYILFITIKTAHRYVATFSPIINSTKMLNATKKAIQKTLRPKQTSLDGIKDKSSKRLKRLKLECRIRGYPIALVRWRLNNILISPRKSQIQISQKKRKSILTIQKPSSGTYECVVESANGSLVSRHSEIKIPRHKEKRPPATASTTTTGRPPGVHCLEPYARSYCQNGGICMNSTFFKEIWCECKDGFDGHWCETKDIKQSMYPQDQPTQNACKLGLVTKFNC